MPRWDKFFKKSDIKFKLDLIQKYLDWMTSYWIPEWVDRMWIVWYAVCLKSIAEMFDLDNDQYGHSLDE